MNDAITLFCLVAGDDPVDRTFSVEISKTDTVDKLKKRIKTENSPRFDDITAQELTLWKVNIPLEKLEDFDSVTNLEASGEKLSPMRKINKVFPKGVKEEHLHIIVVRPAFEDGEELQESEPTEKPQCMSDILLCWKEFLLYLHLFV